MVAHKAKEAQDKKKEKTIGFDELLERDPTFQRAFFKQTKDAFISIYDYLFELVRGQGDVEEKVTAKGDVLLVKPSHDVRVKAAKVLKEMTFDKVMADKRDSGKEKGKDSSVNLREALMEIARQKKKEAEMQALKEGKLKRIRENEG
jgi:hypothetical protein